MTLELAFENTAHFWLAPVRSQRSTGRKSQQSARYSVFYGKKLWSWLLNIWRHMAPFWLAMELAFEHMAPVCIYIYIYTNYGAGFCTYGTLLARVCVFRRVQILESNTIKLTFENFYLAPSSVRCTRP